MMFEAWQIFDMSTEQLQASLEHTLGPADQQLIRDELQERQSCSELQHAILGAMAQPALFLPPVQGAEPSVLSASRPAEPAGASSESLPPIGSRPSTGQSQGGPIDISRSIQLEERKHRRRMRKKPKQPKPAKPEPVKKPPVPSFPKPVKEPRCVQRPALNNTYE